MMVMGNGPIAIRWADIMATAFNLVDYRTIRPVRKARLRLVEPVRAPVAAPVSAPGSREAVAVAAPVPAPANKLLPPAWMVAPPFRAEPALSVHEQQAACRSAPAPAADTPYRTVREAPRAGR